MITSKPNLCGHQAPGLSWREVAERMDTRGLDLPDDNPKPNFCGHQAPGLSWREVAERLDTPGLDLPDATAFGVLMRAWRRGARGEPFPLPALLGRPWANAGGQLAFLRWAAAAPPDVFSFEGAPRRLAPVEGLAGGRSPLGTPNQAWLCLDLYAALARLDEAGLAPACASAAGGARPDLPGGADWAADPARSQPVSIALPSLTRWGRVRCAPTHGQGRLWLGQGRSASAPLRTGLAS